MIPCYSSLDVPRYPDHIPWYTITFTLLFTCAEPSWLMYLFLIAYFQYIFFVVSSILLHASISLKHRYTFSPHVPRNDSLNMSIPVAVPIILRTNVALFSPCGSKTIQSTQLAINSYKYISYILALTIFNEGVIWHLSQSSIRSSIYFSLIVNSRSNPFLEPTSTKQ